MMPRGLVIAIMALSLPAAGHANPEEDLADFIAWFPGRYDSALQVLEQRAARLDPSERNYRRHSIFRRVELPAFGEFVYYAEQYRDGDPDAVYRQRIYVITIDPERDQLRLRVHIPPDTNALLGAYRDPVLLADLTPGDTTVWPGCDLYWAREAERLVGRLDKGACSFESRRFGQRVFLDEYLMLSPDAIWFADRGLSAAGEYLFGMRGDAPTHALKARPFVCTFDDGSTAWLHDQGGSVERSGWRWALQRYGIEDSRGLVLRAHGTGESTSHARVRDAGDIDLVAGETTLSCQLRPDAVYDDGRVSPASPRRLTPSSTQGGAS